MYSAKRSVVSALREAGGRQQPEQVRKNKAALMGALAKYGVTNERLDAVSNYYRYRPQEGEMWPTTPATRLCTNQERQDHRFCHHQRRIGLQFAAARQRTGNAGCHRQGQTGI